MSPGAAPIVDSRWYAAMLGAPFVAVEEVLTARLPASIAALVMRVGILRGLSLGLLAYRSPVVGVIKNTPGALLAVAVAAIRPGRSRLVLLEFIRRPLPQRRWRRRLYLLRFGLLERPLVRRGMAAGQVLTEGEHQAYARLYRVQDSSLQLVPWALTAWGTEPLEPATSRELGVLSSGRTSCDWETLFAAAAGREWPLTVVCANQDRARVDALNRDGRARVYSELPQEEHWELLRASAVYALVVREEESSAGHVRLRSAVDAAVPVVASRVMALDGYLEDGVTGLLVPPGDPDALRSTIDAVLDDPDLRDRLRDAAAERARGWTRADYFDAVRRLLLSAGDASPANVPQ